MLSLNEILICNYMHIARCPVKNDYSLNKLTAVAVIVSTPTGIAAAAAGLKNGEWSDGIDLPAFLAALTSIGSAAPSQ